jgi:hypothetical protein
MAVLLTRVFTVEGQWWWLFWTIRLGFTKDGLQEGKSE